MLYASLIFLDFVNIVPGENLWKNGLLLAFLVIRNCKPLGKLLGVLYSVWNSIQQELI